MRREQRCWGCWFNSLALSHRNTVTNYQVKYLGFLGSLPSAPRRKRTLSLGALLSFKYGGQSVSSVAAFCATSTPRLPYTRENGIACSAPSALSLPYVPPKVSSHGTARFVGEEHAQAMQEPQLYDWVVSRQITQQSQPARCCDVSVPSSLSSSSRRA